MEAIIQVLLWWFFAIVMLIAVCGVFYCAFMVNYGNDPEIIEHRELYNKIKQSKEDGR